MKNVAIIQARMGSTRLPGKVLKEIEGITVLEHIVNRLRGSKKLNEIVIATSINASDEQITKLADKKGWEFFAGSENDVLRRFTDAARLYQAEVVIRVCADCIFYDPQILDDVIAFFYEKKCDYATTTIERTFPRGIAVEVLRYETLKHIELISKAPRHREHMTSFITDNQDQFRVYNFLDKTGSYNPDWRWVLDTPEDFEFAKDVYSDLYKANPLFGIDDIRQWVLKHPEKIIYH
jgi:spore coat polysaccharide biosynthesis protein SpsF